jgi:hypothetical protein
MNWRTRFFILLKNALAWFLENNRLLHCFKIGKKLFNKKYSARKINTILALKRVPLDVRVLLQWLVLYVVALPINDGLQRPHQRLNEDQQVPPPFKSCSKSDFMDKFASTYFRPYNSASFCQVLSKLL